MFNFSSSESEEDVQDDADFAFPACAPINDPSLSEKHVALDIFLQLQQTNFDENVFPQIKRQTGKTKHKRVPDLIT